MAERPATELPPAPAGPHYRTSEPERLLLAALGDPVSVAILAALSHGERDGHSLVVETNLPQSSVYRKLRELEEQKLIEVGRLAFTREGRKVEVFRSRIHAVAVEFEDGRAVVRVRAREDASDRLRDLWQRVRER
jgi:DNA-binding transcriptional ArsR family regulator